MSSIPEARVLRTCVTGAISSEKQKILENVSPKSLLQKHCLKPSAYLMHFELFHGGFRDLSSSQGELVSHHLIVHEECHDVTVLRCWHMVIFGIQEEG